MVNATQQQYVECKGLHCPKCASQRHTGGSVIAEAGKAWQEIVCDDCGANWNDQYELTGYRLIEED